MASHLPRSVHGNSGICRDSVPEAKRINEIVSQTDGAFDAFREWVLTGVENGGVRDALPSVCETAFERIAAAGLIDAVLAPLSRLTLLAYAVAREMTNLVRKLLELGADAHHRVVVDIEDDDGLQHECEVSIIELAFYQLYYKSFFKDLIMLCPWFRIKDEFVVYDPPTETGFSDALVYVKILSASEAVALRNQKMNVCSELIKRAKPGQFHCLVDPANRMSLAEIVACSCSLEMLDLFAGKLFGAPVSSGQTMPDLLSRVPGTCTIKILRMSFQSLGYRGILEATKGRLSFLSRCGQDFNHTVVTGGRSVYLFDYIADQIGLTVPVGRSPEPEITLYKQELLEKLVECGASPHLVSKGILHGSKTTAYWQRLLSMYTLKHPWSPKTHRLHADGPFQASVLTTMMIWRHESTGFQHLPVEVLFLIFGRLADALFL